MACATPSITVESRNTSGSAHTTATDPVNSIPTQRRRHSSYQPWRRHSNDLDSDAVFMKVDLFISELERRLDWIENYGNLKLDATINRAYSTLDAVRDSCSHVSGELIGAGRRRARILVETVESRYKDVLPTKTLEAKAQAGMRLMEGFLNELETRALAVRDSGISEIIDGRWPPSVKCSPTSKPLRTFAPCPICFSLRAVFAEHIQCLVHGLGVFSPKLLGIMHQRNLLIAERVAGGWTIAQERYGKARGKAKEVVDEGLEKARRAKETLKESIDNAITIAKENRLISYDGELVPYNFELERHVSGGIGSSLLCFAYNEI